MSWSSSIAATSTHLKYLKCHKLDYCWRLCFIAGALTFSGERCSFESDRHWSVLLLVSTLVAVRTNLDSLICSFSWQWFSIRLAFWQAYEQVSFYKSSQSLSPFWIRVTRSFAYHLLWHGWILKVDCCTFRCLSSATYTCQSCKCLSIVCRIRSQTGQ